MEFLEIKLIDDDFWKLLVRLLINAFFLIVLVRAVYFPRAGVKNYFFSFIMVNIIIFFICFTLKKFELGLGMALGLFAIFGVLRYRTDSIPIREMTYLFLVIGLAVINALSNTKMSYAEIFFTNGMVVIVTFVLEKIRMPQGQSRTTLVYDNMQLIRPENYQDMIADVENRTGLVISRIEIGRIDFPQGKATLDIIYDPEKQAGVDQRKSSATGRRVEIGVRQKK